MEDTADAQKIGNLENPNAGATFVTVSGYLDFFVI
jgi:hypothetical protein